MLENLHEGSISCFVETLLAVFVLFVLVIEAKPVHESSSASNDKQAIKPNQQLYEIYKFMQSSRWYLRYRINESQIRASATSGLNSLKT
ncbi:unnamed protein product [Adineta ricciae]|uniref:Uncharacterized protein n=1 Tax=Adineta ricciae TaxID=249248 RepID=A0A814G3D0_ADIRI|nr:unnamed protein product [Adineta ricciae]